MHMTKSELKQLIRECITETADASYTAVKPSTKNAAGKSSTKQFKSAVADQKPKRVAKGTIKEDDTPPQFGGAGAEGEAEAPKDVTITLPLDVANALLGILATATEALNGEEKGEEGGEGHAEPDGDEAVPQAGEEGEEEEGLV